MAQYQIEATIEKIVVKEKDKDFYIHLKGCGKYLFIQSKKINVEVYWNIFESIDAEDAPLVIKQNENHYIRISKDKIGMYNLISHTFCEKKKLRFELKIESLQQKNIDKQKPGSKKQYLITITAISHVTQ
jgi:hypothetical protein